MESNYIETFLFNKLYMNNKMYNEVKHFKTQTPTAEKRRTNNTRRGKRG